MRRAARWLLAGAALLLQTACLDIADPETASKTSGGAAGQGGGGVAGAAGWAGAGGSGGGSGGAVTPCLGCGASSCECVPPAPSGWAYARWSKLGAGCPSGYSEPMQFTSLVDSGCEPCACGALSATCKTEADWMGASCAVGPAQIDALNQANPISCQPSGATSVRLAMEYAGGGGCVPVNQPIPPPAIGSALCSVLSTTACDAGACVPVGDALEPTPCVVSQVASDADCPAGYPKKQSLVESWSDSRVCTGCACGTPSADTVDCASLQQPQVCDDCGATVGCKLAAWNSCVATATTGHAVLFDGPAPAAKGTCPAIGQSKVASGSLSATKTRVVCCSG